MSNRSTTFQFNSHSFFCSYLHPFILAGLRILIIIIAGATTATAVLSAELYNNGVLPANAQGGQLSDLQEVFVAGDDFTLSGAATVRSVTFSGSYVATLTPAPDEFVMKIYQDNGAFPPGALIASSTLTGTRVNEVNINPAFYAYEMNLDSPVALAAGDYYFVIYNDTSCEPATKWSFRHTTNASTISISADIDSNGNILQWYGFLAERVFSLRDDVFSAVPDPRGCSGGGAQADLTVDISGPPSVLIQTNYAYTVMASNNGPDDATGVSMDTVLPADVMFISASPAAANCTSNGNLGATVTCNIGGLASGANSSVQIDVAAPFSATGLITATSTVSANEADPVANNNDSHDVFVDPLMVQIQDSLFPEFDRHMSFGNEAIGATATATLTFINDGLQPLTVNIVTGLQDPFTIVDPANCDGVTVAGRSSCQMTVTFSPQALGDFDDDITLSFGVGAAAIRVTGSGANAMADLAISKTANPNLVSPGVSGSDLTSFTIAVSNNGPDDASVVANDVLPTGFTIPVGMVPPAYDVTTGDWMVGPLAANSSAQLVIPAQVAGVSGCIINTATVAFAAGANAGDPDLANNTATALVGAGSCVDFALSVDVTETINLDGRLVVSFNITATNNGTSDAMNVTLVSDVRGFDDESNERIAPAPAGVNCPPDPVQGIFIPAPECTLGTMAPGKTTIISHLIETTRTGGDLNLDYDIILRWDTGGATQQMQIQDSILVVRFSGQEGSGSGGCFIATAAYGSYLEPEVVALRKFRDDVLLNSRLGKLFVDAYYATSPPIAEFISQHESLRVIARFALTPIVYSIKYPLLTAILLIVLAWLCLIRRKRLA